MRGQSRRCRFLPVCAADLIELQQPVQAAVTVPAHLGKDGEVGPQGPPHLADDPPGEPKAVFHTAAVCSAGSISRAGPTGSNQLFSTMMEGEL